MKDDKDPPEALILFAGMGIVFGGTILINIVINAIFFQ